MGNWETRSLDHLLADPTDTSSTLVLDDDRAGPRQQTLATPFLFLDCSITQVPQMLWQPDCIRSLSAFVS